MDTQHAPKQPEVTTEPQRRALDEMSRRLVQQLNAMIAEQDERVRAFISQQRSRSTQPNGGLPAASPDSPPAPAARTAPTPPPPLPKARQNIPAAPPLPFRPEPRPTPAPAAETSGNWGWLITIGCFLLFLLFRSCN